MGYDAGFDMVPQLGKEAPDRDNWKSFIEIITERYQQDNLVEATSNYLVFKVGEHPKLPFEGHKFLRFSSKISGSHCKGVEEYIDAVYKIAKIRFGVRVQYWNEIRDHYGFYGWGAVHKSEQSYDQVEEAVVPPSTNQKVFGREISNELCSNLFAVQAIPGRGNGLIAAINIEPGTRILDEKPLFTTTNILPISLMEKMVAKILKSLSKDEQRQFLSLHNNFPGKHPFSGIVRTNALPCGPDSVVGGLYPTICLVNHSCIPNAHNSWNSETGRETIHAISSIKAGDEITISYDKGGASETRRRHLKEAFGFNCDCGVCSLPSAELNASDVRRLRAQDLDDALADPWRVMKQPEDCLTDCRSLMQLLGEEYHANAGIRIARLYYDAFQISITHGDQARASVFAQRGFESRVICEGRDSPETVRLEAFVKNPASHRNFGITKHWRTSKSQVPKGLEKDEFEAWLWRAVK